MSPATVYGTANSRRVAPTPRIDAVIRFWFAVGDHSRVGARGELTDRAWTRIEPLLPPIESGGRRWRDHRQVINAILRKLRTGAPWRDLPERYGPWKTAHERLRIWTSDGTWDRILDEVIVEDDSVGNVEWTFSIDSSFVRAHQHSA